MPRLAHLKGNIGCRHGLVQGGLLMPVLWLALASSGFKDGRGRGEGSQNTVLLKYSLTPKLSPVNAEVRVGGGLMSKP